MFWCVRTSLVHLGPFGWLLKLGTKRAELVQKFVPRSCLIIFRNEHTRSTPLDPKLMFWCIRTILVHFGPFGWLTKLGAKWAELVQKFVSRSHVGNFRNQCTQSTPLDPKLIFWCVFYNFGAFGTVWLPYGTRCKIGWTSAKVRATKSRRNFFATNTPDPPHWTLNWCFGAFCTIWVHLSPFGCLTKLGAKHAELVQKFVPRIRVELFATNAPDPPH